MHSFCQSSKHPARYFLAEWTEGVGYRLCLIGGFRYRASEPGSRMDIPLEISRIPRFDPPVVRTITGAVFLTVSDADMIEIRRRT